MFCANKTQSLHLVTVFPYSVHQFFLAILLLFYRSYYVFLTIAICIHLCFAEKVLFQFLIFGLLTEPEIIIVPDRFSYRVPFAALRDEPAGRYLSDKYRIRIVPSLTTLRLIQECPADYHIQTGALVVGDPTVGKVHYNGRLTDIIPLFYARKEAEMVGLRNNIRETRNCVSFPWRISEG